MTRKLTLNQARRAALRGQTETALTALQSFADAGDASASYSLTELLAFRGEWEECAIYAGRLLASPGSVYAGNVFYETIGLMGQCGHHTGNWNQIIEVVDNAIRSIDQTVQPPHLQTWYLKLLQALDNYAQHQGTLPYKTIRVFGPAPPFAQADQNAAYLKAKVDVVDGFALAKSCHQEEEVIRLYLAREMPRNFDNAVYLARVFCSRGDAVRAWKVLWSHMSLECV